MKSDVKIPNASRLERISNYLPENMRAELMALARQMRSGQSFQDWFDDLQEVAIKDYSVFIADCSENKNSWKAYYEAGLTPRESILADMNYGV